MSSRAIRRLRQEQLEATRLDNVEDESEEEEEQVVVQTTGFLDLDDDSSDDESESSSSNDDDNNSASTPKPLPSKLETKNKKKREEEEDIDTIISSFQTVTAAAAPKTQPASTPTLRNILLSQQHGYDIQALDLDNAVKSLLGGGVAIGGGDHRLNETPRGGGRSGGRGVGGGRRTVKRYLFGRPRE
jgi:hypothetical protein